ncbi:hypothetical protein [uncultured Rikenella sp.]|uniref:hypothetical protein n=1 Tax=uncultured Rikenella sp. TaxID=368003 RepID=UPI0026059AB5|nr:hypothetical protein [uncultured Rikenella sp.]
MPLGINGQEALDGTDWGLRTRAWAYFLSDFAIRAPLGPAPGYRHRDTGFQGNIGYCGSSRSSSTANGTDDARLDFSVAWLYPGYASGRAYGLQLRCLSE